MLARCDAALIIGDNALFCSIDGIGPATAGAVTATDVDREDRSGRGLDEMTGLPFVWAFWAGRPTAR